MLYIESPITVGFSYDPQGEQSDESTANYNINALIDFFSKFQEYKNLPFFIRRIISWNLHSNIGQSFITMLAIGNGCTDPTECTDESKRFKIHVYKYYGSHNFISKQLYVEILAFQNAFYQGIVEKCQGLAERVQEEICRTMQEKIQFNPYNIYGYCFSYTPEGSKMSWIYNCVESKNEDSDIPTCVDVLGLYYHLRSDEVRTLLKIRQKSAQWNICSTLDKYENNPKAFYYLNQNILKNQISIWQLWIKERNQRYLCRSLQKVSTSLELIKFLLINLKKNAFIYNQLNDNEYIIIFIKQFTLTHLLTKMFMNLTFISMRLYNQFKEIS